MQFAHKLRMQYIFKARGLRHVNFFLKDVMQECIFDI